MCAAFSSATDTVAAAVEARLGLHPPMRIVLASGSAELWDGDYFGPVLNLVARVMAAGHGGQIVVSAWAAGLVDRVALAALGVDRLRDLSGMEHLFEVRAPGLKTRFSLLAHVGCRVVQPAGTGHQFHRPGFEVAARMVSMSAMDVRDHLDDCFRLLARGQPCLLRHQTLRQEVVWHTAVERD